MLDFSTRRIYRPSKFLSKVTYNSFCLKMHNIFLISDWFFVCFLKRTQLLSDLKQNSLHFFYQCSLHARIHAAKFFPYCIFLTVSNVISLIFKVFPSYVVMDLWPGNSQNYLLMLGQYFYRTILMGRKRLNQ